MTNPTKTRRRFTAQQKQEAVELCLTEGLSCLPLRKSIGRALEEAYTDTFRSWLRATVNSYENGEASFAIIAKLQELDPISFDAKSFIDLHPASTL